MKKIFIFLLLFSAWLTADISWQKEITTAIKVAKKENKTIMVFVVGQSCRWCVKMKRRTLSDENVDKRLKSYIAVKVYREDEKAVSELPEIYGVPTIFFMTPDKQIVESVVGYFNVEDFISYIDDVEKKLKK